LGSIDEVSVYNRALSASEIQSIYAADTAGKCVPPVPTNCVTAPSGMISWWRAEGDATDALTANNGTLMNGATFAPGEVGQAFSLDGIDDYVSIPLLNFSSRNAITIEAWIKPT